MRLMENEKKTLKKKKTTRKSPKIITRDEELYYCIRDGSTKNYSRKDAIQVARQYYDYSLDEETVTKNKFYQTHSVTDKTMKRLRERYPEVDEIYQAALMNIADRREEGAVKNKLNGSFVLSTQARYCNETMQVAKMFIDYKANANKGSDLVEGLAVIMNNFPKLTHGS